MRLLSVSHRTAALTDLEVMALPAAVQADLRRTLRQGGIRTVMLCTCNRTELYWCSRSPSDDSAVQAALIAAIPRRVVLPRKSFVHRAGIDVATHLFRVTAGLESLIVGEGEVLGQVRDAIEAAEGAGGSGPILSELFRAALRCGGRVRSETQIGTGALSAASASVQILCQTHPDLAQCTVLVIGAGITGLKTARHLKARGVGRLIMVNRTVQRAMDAASELGAEASSIDDVPDLLTRADGVIVAARPANPLITPAMLRKVFAQGRSSHLALIDLSLPRAIDPGCGRMNGVVLHDLLDLKQIVGHHRAGRECEIPRVEALIEVELEIFRQHLRESNVRPLVAELRRRADAIRREEIARSLQDGRIDAQSVEHLTRRLVNRLLHAPSLALRRGGLELDTPPAGYLRSLFGLESDDRETR